MLTRGDKLALFAVLTVGSGGTAVFVSTPAGSTWQIGAWVGTLLLAAWCLLARLRTAARLRRQLTRAAETEERLAAQQAELARYAAIVCATDDAAAIVSLDGLILDWNSAAEQLYGYTRDEVLGKSIAVLAPDVFDELAAAGAGTRASFETVHLRKDGSTAHTAVIVSEIRGEAGEACGAVLIARDVSERVTRDAERHRESKLESLGRLSAGLAHEINSPIQFVGDNARFLEEAYQELIRVVEVYRALLDTSSPIGWTERQERVREVEAGIDFDYLEKEIPSAVEQTLEGIERVSTIVRAMKTFSHPGHKEQVPANLNEALEATVTVTRHQVRAVADLELDLAALPPVRCNIADLNQVFLNLIVNAADAIEETGQHGPIRICTAQDGDDVVIRISDTGGGIPDDVRSKIFDPFFTTKDVGRGSGQGLPLARGVVQEGHGGTLTLDTVLGQGTTFTVRLPIDGHGRSELVELDA
jgi:two-component system NtrC family sensor kinase